MVEFMQNYEIEMILLIIRNNSSGVDGMFARGLELRDLHENDLAFASALCFFRKR